MSYEKQSCVLNKMIIEYFSKPSNFELDEANLNKSQLILWVCTDGVVDIII